MLIFIKYNSGRTYNLYEICDAYNSDHSHRRMCGIIISKYRWIDMKMYKEWSIVNIFLKKTKIEAPLNFTLSEIIVWNLILIARWISSDILINLYANKINVRPTGIHVTFSEKKNVVVNLNNWNNDLKYNNNKKGSSSGLNLAVLSI